MKRKIKVQPGDLIKVPYKPGFHTYARILVENSYAFYDCISKIDRNDYDNIIKSEILFTAYVDVFALKEGYWTIVANVPLEGNLKSFYPRYFNPAPMNIENVNFYNVYKSEIENAIEKDWIKTGKIQLDGIHGRIHIESRINVFIMEKETSLTGEILIFLKIILDCR